MAFKLNRPFSGRVATFERPSEFFDWLAWYEANSEFGVSGMIWNDDKPVGTVAMVLEMGRDAFLSKYDPAYEPPVTKSSILERAAAEMGLEVVQIPMSRCDPADLRGVPAVEYVTYAHASAPNGQRFRDVKGNEPSWAVDIQPCVDLD